VHDGSYQRIEGIEARLRAVIERLCLFECSGVALLNVFAVSLGAI
jgi:hypothetical protein